MYTGVATSRQGEEDFDVGHKFQSRPQQQVEGIKYGSRGKSAAPKGCPSIHCTSKPNTSSANWHVMPVRREPKGKKPHSLVANIRAGQQNAGKW